MKSLRYLFVAVLVLASLPFGAFAAPATSGLIMGAELHVVTGGGCSTCNDDEDPGLGTKVKNEKIGQPYWEFTRQMRNRTTFGPWISGTRHINATNRPQPFIFTYTEVTGRNWSVGGGLPAAIVQASVGGIYTNTTSRQIPVTLDPYERIRIEARTATDHDTYFYTLYQDYTLDRSRMRDATASVSITSTETRNIPY